MQNRGFSLVEMMVVVAVASILIATATLNFIDYYRRYRTESQTRLIYSQLQKARGDAICQRRSVRVKLYPGRFEVYSSLQDDSCGVKPWQTYSLNYPLIFTLNGHTAGQISPTFDKNGTVSGENSICLAQGGDSGSVDSIVVSATRTNLGKRKDPRDGCNSNNIIFR